MSGRPTEQDIGLQCLGPTVVSPAHRLGSGVASRKAALLCRMSVFDLGRQGPAATRQRVLISPSRVLNTAGAESLTAPWAGSGMV